ncbi:MAG: hypothetical protein Q7S57_05770 [bacterium]|nr:hypothetical protein [bacterium]
MTVHGRTTKLVEVYEKYIKGTPEKGLVEEKKFLVCFLTQAVCKGMNFNSNKVYISTRVLKHMYDKKPAEEFNFLLVNLNKIVRYPDHIYANKLGKRGDICLQKCVAGNQYLCSIEFVGTEEEQKEIQITTAFRIRKSNYLLGYKLLWSWKGDIPSS